MCSVGTNCGSLTSPANGSVDLSEGTLVNASVSYSCDEGFNLRGVDSRTCLSSGNWTGSEPECISKYRYIIPYTGVGRWFLSYRGAPRLPQW